MNVSMDALLNAGGYLALAGAIYGGIRADLKHLHEKVAMALSAATRAHERIDNHLEKAP